MLPALATVGRCSQEGTVESLFFAGKCKCMYSYFMCSCRYISTCIISIQKLQSMHVFINIKCFK